MNWAPDRAECKGVAGRNARELRDRYLEQVNAAGLVSGGKYDVSQVLEASGKPVVNRLLLGDKSAA
jgi:hypothetical protein